MRAKCKRRCGPGSRYPWWSSSSSSSSSNYCGSRYSSNNCRNSSAKDNVEGWVRTNRAGRSIESSGVCHHSRRMRQGRCRWVFIPNRSSSQHRSSSSSHRSSSRHCYLPSIASSRRTRSSSRCSRSHKGVCKSSLLRVCLRCKVMRNSNSCSSSGCVSNRSKRRMLCWRRLRR